jgi:hypothetical protein
MQKEHVTLIAHRVSVERCQPTAVCVSSHVQAGDIFVLEDIGQYQVVEEELKLWSHAGSLNFTLTDIVHDDVQEPELGSIVTRLMSHNAFPKRPVRFWPLVWGQSKCMDALISLGYLQIEQADGQRLGFCEKALAHGAMRSFYLLKDPVCAIAAANPLSPLEDMDNYYLLKSVYSLGWKWAEWVRPAKRRAQAHRAVQECPVGYKPGDRKVFFSSSWALHVSRYYLMALLRAEDYES